MSVSLSRSGVRAGDVGERLGAEQMCLVSGKWTELRWDCDL
jgi:hypothetical protein